MSSVVLPRHTSNADFVSGVGNKRAALFAEAIGVFVITPVALLKSAVYRAVNIVSGSVSDTWAAIEAALGGAEKEYTTGITAFNDLYATPWDPNIDFVVNMAVSLLKLTPASFMHHVADQYAELCGHIYHEAHGVVARSFHEFLVTIEGTLSYLREIPDFSEVMSNHEPIFRILDSLECNRQPKLPQSAANIQKKQTSINSVDGQSEHQPQHAGENKDQCKHTQSIRLQWRCAQPLHYGAEFACGLLEAIGKRIFQLALKAEVLSFDDYHNMHTISCTLMVAAGLDEHVRNSILERFTKITPVLYSTNPLTLPFTLSDLYEVLPWHFIVDRRLNFVNVGSSLNRILSLSWLERHPADGGGSGGENAPENDGLLKRPTPSNSVAVMKPGSTGSISWVSHHLSEHLSLVLPFSPNITFDLLKQLQNRSVVFSAKLPAHQKITASALRSRQGEAEQNAKTYAAIDTIEAERVDPSLSTLAGGEEQRATGDGGAHNSTPEPFGASEVEDEGGSNTNFSEMETEDATAASSERPTTSRAQSENRKARRKSRPNVLQTLEIRGSVMYISEFDVLAFRGMPVVETLEELSERGLCLSDIPMYDPTRDVVMMDEQTRVHFNIKEKLEWLRLGIEKKTEIIGRERVRNLELLNTIYPESIAAKLWLGDSINVAKFDNVTIYCSTIVDFERFCRTGFDNGAAAAGGSTTTGDRNHHHKNDSETSSVTSAVRTINLLMPLLDLYTTKAEMYKVQLACGEYVSVAGLHVRSAHHAAQAAMLALLHVRAAEQVTENLGNGTATTASGSKNFIQIRVGLHSGSVLVGAVGLKVPRLSLHGRDFLAAQKFACISMPGVINVSSETAALLKSYEKTFTLTPFVAAGDPKKPEADIVQFPPETANVRTTVGIVQSYALTLVPPTTKEDMIMHAAKESVDRGRSDSRHAKTKAAGEQDVDDPYAKHLLNALRRIRLQRSEPVIKPIP